MSLRYSNVAAVVDVLTRTGAYRATKYISETHTVKATRRHKVRRGEPLGECVLTMGRPNYDEREFIKKCKKAGERFPVKKIQLKF